MFLELIWEFIMGKKTPVTISGVPFSSINKARQYYTEILHRYTPGQSLAQEDRLEIARLNSVSPDGRDREPPKNVKVVISRFARPCFEIDHASHLRPHCISMIRCIAAHVEKTTQP